MAESSHNKLLHHIAVGFGFLFLIAYYILIEKTGLFEWVTSKMPEAYAGAGLMLGIMIGMVPGFLIWKYYNRWIEKKLGVQGKYIEDEYYKDQAKQKDQQQDKNSD